MAATLHQSAAHSGPVNASGNKHSQTINDHEAMTAISFRRKGLLADNGPYNPPSKKCVNTRPLRQSLLSSLIAPEIKYDEIEWIVMYQSPAVHATTGPSHGFAN